MASDRESKPIKVGIYARVSTAGGRQDIGLQVDELTQVAQARGYKVTHVYRDDGISGTKQARPGLDAMLADAQVGQFSVLLVWKLDRLGRSLQNLLQILDDLARWGVGFSSIHDPGLDSTTSTGRLLIQLLACFAEYERSIIQERVQAGVARAQAAGKHCGRPPRDIDMRLVQALFSEGRSIRETASILGIPRSTLQRHLKVAKQGGPKASQKMTA